MEAHRIFRTKDQGVIIGAGEDDVAAVQCGECILLFTSDYKNSKRIIERFEDLDYSELGRYCVRQNLCDILGSGGTPKWFMLSVIFDEYITKENISIFFDSVSQECHRFGITVVGGDTKQGDRTVVNGTLIGICEGPVWAHRNAVVEHDIYVTGPLGGVTAALCILELSSDDLLRRDALALLTETDVPIDVIESVIALKEKCAASDISDGLGYSIHQILNSSNIAATVSISKIPLHPLASLASQHLGVNPYSFAFGYGGDFQVVFTAPRRLDDALRSFGAINIGSISSGEPVVVDAGGDEIFPIPDFGHLDFVNQSIVERFLAFANSLPKYENLPPAR
ncbi:MAG: thiamine-phosphate kinase [Pseudomonadota bacterium]